MVKKSIVVCTIAMIIISLGCSAGDPTSRLKSLMGKQITAMENLVK